MSWQREAQFQSVRPCLVFVGYVYSVWYQRLRPSLPPTYKGLHFLAIIFGYSIFLVNPSRTAIDEYCHTGSCLGTEKTVEHESDVYTNYNWCSWYSHQRIIKGIGGLGNRRTSGDHPNNCIVEIDQNTEKSPGD